MDDEIDIKDLLFAIWRKKVFILIFTFVFLLLGILIYGKKTVEPKSVDKFEKVDIENLDYIITEFMFNRGKEDKVENPEINATYKLGIDDGVITNLNKFATSEVFLENVINNLSYDKKINVKDLKSNINISRVGTSDIMTLVVGFEDKEIAKKISENILNELQNKINILYNIENIIIIDGPVELAEEESPKLEKQIQASEANLENQGEIQEESPKKKIILVTIVGFVLACGIVVVVEILSDSVKSEYSLEKATNLKTLVKLPKTTLDLSDKFKLLRVNLNECKTILVTSPENGDGKSFVALNLAKSYSRLGKKVLLIDLVNNSNDIVKKYNGNGLTDYLASGENSTSNFIANTNVKNLDILLAGKDLTNQPELLDSYKMKDTLKLLENLYEVIIIDSNNVLESASTLTIAHLAKYTILVVSERKTKIMNVVKAKNNIEDIGGNVVGTVYNNCFGK